MNPTRRVLLVEGSNDKHVVWALLEHHKVTETFRVEEISGIDKRIENARVRLKALRNAESLERLGIVVDADEDQPKRWQQLAAAVRDTTGVELPADPSKDGTVISVNGGRTFGAWLMPDNKLPGKLEDFLAFLVPPHDVLLPAVDTFLGTLPSRDACPARFPDKDRIKARIHSWLAIQEQPGKPMGQAITARYLDASAPMALEFIAWLKRLFVE
jgi:hypothetical protein